MLHLQARHLFQLRRVRSQISNPQSGRRVPPSAFPIIRVGAEGHYWEHPHCSKDTPRLLLCHDGDWGYPVQCTPQRFFVEKVLEPFCVSKCVLCRVCTASLRRLSLDLPGPAVRRLRVP